MIAYKQKRRRPLPSPFLPRSGCHVKGRRWRPWFSRSKIAAPKEKRHPKGCLFSFVTAHMFCCLHSRPPQGRGSVRGEPLTGSPTRVQSPARRRPLLRSKSAAPKKKDTHVGVFLFWCARRDLNCRGAVLRRVDRCREVLEIQGLQEVMLLNAAGLYHRILKL